jgi:hypothetical protein
MLIGQVKENGNIDLALDESVDLFGQAEFLSQSAICCIAVSVGLIVVRKQQQQAAPSYLTEPKRALASVNGGLQTPPFSYSGSS